MNGKKYSEAREKFDRLKEVLRAHGSPTFEPTVYRLRAECLLMADTPEKTEAALEDLTRYIDMMKALGREPDGSTLSHRGVAYGRLKRLKDAHADFTWAIKIKPELPDGWNNRGFCRFQMEDYRGAIEDYQRGADVCRKLGLLYAPAGNSAYAFVLKIADVFDQLAKLYRSRGDEENAKLAGAEAEKCRANAKTLVKLNK